MIVIEHDDGFDAAVEFSRQLRAQDNLLNVPVLLVADDLDEAPKELDEGNEAITSDAMITDLIPTVRRIFDTVMRRIYLLVEHKGDVGEIRDSFRYNGYAAKCYTSLDELTKAADERAPDLVLVNVTEEIELVCASLKMDAATASVPIVLTADGVVGSHREAHMMGADYYLTKIDDIVSLARMLIKDGQ
jgi:CheY-like chemotaxis protein